MLLIKVCADQKISHFACMRFVLQIEFQIKNETVKVLCLFVRKTRDKRMTSICYAHAALLIRRLLVCIANRNHSCNEFRTSASARFLLTGFIGLQPPT
jgi:hypothetical protein